MIAKVLSDFALSQNGGGITVQRKFKIYVNGVVEENGQKLKMQEMKTNKQLDLN